MTRAAGEKMVSHSWLAPTSTAPLHHCTQPTRGGDLCVCNLAESIAPPGQMIRHRSSRGVGTTKRARPSCLEQGRVTGAGEFFLGSWGSVLAS